MLKRLKTTLTGPLAFWVICVGGCFDFSAQPASNDDFADRTFLVERHKELDVSNRGATKENGEPNHAGQSGGSSLWWLWQPPESGLAVLDLTGSSIDTVAVVYIGKSLNTLSSLASDDNGSGDGRSSWLAFDVEAGNDYQIVVDGKGGQQGNIHFVLRLITSPEFRRHPQAQVVTYGQNAVFEAEALGAKPLSYQWLFEGSDLPGQTSPTLRLNTIQTAQQGLYSLEVRNGHGSALSQPALLQVLRAPVVSRHPGNVNVAAGSTARFDVEVLGEPPLQFQWFYNNQPLAGQNQRVLSLDNAQDPMEGQYHVTVSNASGSARSNEARLQVVTPPPNDDHVNRILLNLPDTGSQSVSDTGSNIAATREQGEPLHHNRDGEKSVWWAVESPGVGLMIVDLSGSGFDTLLGVYTGDFVDQLTPIASDDDSGSSSASRVAFQTDANALYSIAVAGFSRQEGPVRIEVIYKDQSIVAPPVITRQCQDQSVRSCGEVVFFIEAGSEAPMKYQWHYNGNPIPGATSSSLRLTDVQVGQVGLYEVEVTNLAGKIRSRQASLTVEGAPGIRNHPISLTVQKCKTAVLSVGVEGCPPFTYQWFKNGVPLLNATESSYRIETADIQDEGSYTVVVGNFGGEVESDPALVSVNRLPVITNQPRSVWQRLERDAEISVGVDSCDPVEVHWVFQDMHLLTAGGNTLGWGNARVDPSGKLHFTALSTNQSGFYKAVAVNAFGSVTSQVGRLTVAVPPVNDDFINAIFIEGTNTVAQGTNYAADKEGGEPGHAGNPGGASVWWFWQAPLTALGHGTNFIRLNNSNFDTTLGVYKGSSVSNLTEVVSDNNGGNGNRSLVSYPVVPGDLTFIAVDGWNGQTGQVHLAVEFIPEISPPIIIRQPQSQAAKEGQSVRFEVQAKGSPFIQYQWRFNAVDILGATNAVLEIFDVAEAVHEGNYTVHLRNSFGETNSHIARLTFGAIVRGQVTDATNGRPIPGARVEAGGEVTLTDEGGNYTLVGVEPGRFNAEFDADNRLVGWNQDVRFINLSTLDSITLTGKKENFYDYVNHNVRVTRGEAVVLSFSMSPVLIDSLRFVLNWGLNPADLDAHLVTPEIQDQSYEIFYLPSQRGNAEAIPHVVLDHDVRESFGPETITIHSFHPGLYHLFVKKFDPNALGSLSGSEAVVKIYNDDGLIRTMEVPPGQGRYWYVAVIDGRTRNITYVNRLQDLKPSGVGALNQMDPGIDDGKRALLNTRGFRSIPAVGLHSFTPGAPRFDWFFGDGSGVQNNRNPVHRYDNPGKYDVTLRMSGVQKGEEISDSETKIAFITVTNGPPLVHLIHPVQHYVLPAFRPTVLRADARDSEPEGQIVHVEFFVDNTSLGRVVEFPHELNWTPQIPNGQLERNFEIHVEATDQHGAITRTEPVSVRVLDLLGDVLFVSKTRHDQIDHLAEWVGEVEVFDHDLDSLRYLVSRHLLNEDFEFRLAKDFKLVVWHDLGVAQDNLTDPIVDSLERLHHHGIPLYLMGGRLLNSGSRLSDDRKEVWRSLIRLQSESDILSEGKIELLKNPDLSQDYHPLVSWPYGEVFDFPYEGELENGKWNGSKSEVVAVSGGSDLMVAYPPRDSTLDSLAAVRMLSQNFSLWGGPSTRNSADREALFKNAVCWLVDCAPCIHVNVWLTGETSHSTAEVGDLIDIVLQVRHNGACQASGALVDVELDERLQFIAAEADQGLHTHEDGRIRFVLGVLSKANVTKVAVRARALGPGPSLSRAQVRINGKNLRDPNLSIPIELAGDPLPSAPLKLGFRRNSGGITLVLESESEGDYEIQQSENLVDWVTSVRAAHSTASPLELPIPQPESRSRFFRVVAVD